MLGIGPRFHSQPLARNAFEARPAFTLLRLALRARIDTGFNQILRLLSALSSERKGHSGIHAERQRFFEAVDAVFQSPPAPTARRDQQIHAAAVRHLVEPFS